MSKAQLFEQWRSRLTSVRGDLVAVQDQARAGTRVDGQHRPENRGERAAVTTQGYLAAGLGARVTALDAALDLLDRMDPASRETVVTGALVELESEEGAELRLVVLPGGDGSALGGVLVVSPDAPIARALWGLRAEDEATLTRGGQESEWVILSVR